MLHAFAIVFLPRQFNRVAFGVTILLFHYPLFAQEAPDFGNQPLNYGYLEEIFAKVSDPDIATTTFYEALEKLRDPSPTNEKRLARLYADIIDIMSGTELDQWKNLQATEDKVAFLKRFWLGRDLTPATVTNERLVEHYTRLLYARKWYSYQDLRGYDDRGMIYIQYGPPDNHVEDVLASLTYPVSSWVYFRFGRSVNFDFIDKGYGYRLNSRLIDAIVNPIPGWYEGPLAALVGRRMALSITYAKLYSDIEGIRSNIQKTRKEEYFIQFREKADRAFNEFVLGVRENQAKLPKTVSEVFQGIADLPCEVKLAQFEGKDDQPNLVVVYGFNKVDLKGKEDSLHVQIATVLRDTTMAILASQNMTRHFALNTSLRFEEFVGVETYSLPVSKYYYAIEVTNTFGRQRGLRDFSLVLGRYPEGVLHLSNVIFAKEITSATDSLIGPHAFKRHNFTITPYPFTKLKRHLPIFVYFEIYDLKRDKNGETFYEITYEVQAPGKRGLASLWASLNPFDKSSGSISVSETRRDRASIEPTFLQLDFSQSIKKMRLKLKDLKVQSFITALSDAEKIRIKGGAPEISNNGEPCPTCPKPPYDGTCCPPLTAHSECNVC
jgi:GWxTD domain-containing protein